MQRTLRALLLLLAATALPAVEAQDGVHRTELHAVRVSTLVGGLDRPWALAFLPDGRMLVTERRGRLRVIGKDGKLEAQPVAGVPHVDGHDEGQGGLLDLVLHPRFADNGWIYFAYVQRRWWRYGTEVARAKLAGGPGRYRLESMQVVWRQQPKSRNDYQFGARIVFDRSGLMFVTLGDCGEKAPAQDLTSHLGKIVRLTDTGQPAAGNPFASERPALPDIYSYGHRNVQAAALQPSTGALWIGEHGPDGGDELNLIKPGLNYGWPVISHGKDYRTGKPFGVGTAKEGMEQPVRHWSPSPAFSGMVFYEGDRFPHWRGDALIGALRGQAVLRVRLQGERVVAEEFMLKGTLPRVRDVRVGPDGLVYLLSDLPAGQGAVLRLEPVAR